MVTNSNRQPAGVPIGGQFAATSRPEADVEDLGVYGSPGECVAIGVHGASVDDDGYCNHCGDPAVDDDRHGVSDAYPNGRCTACGSGADESGRCYQAECSNFAATSPFAVPPVPQAAIKHGDHRERCFDFAATYADPPADPTVVANGPTMTMDAVSLQIGDRLATGCVISDISRSDDATEVWVDGEEKSSFRIGNDAPMLVHCDRVDWTDPTWFEAEAHRIVSDQRDRNQVVDEPALRGRLTRMSQPRNISPLDANMTGRVNGRAKVGDNVIFEQPMHGSSSFEVLGKMHRTDIASADEDGVHWVTTREVEYVLKDLGNGSQTVGSLTGPGWRRIPAPKATTHGQVI